MVSLPLPLQLNSIFYLLLKGCFEDYSTSEVWRKRKAAVHSSMIPPELPHHNSYATRDSWQMEDHGLWCSTATEVHCKIMKNMKHDVKLHPWSCLRAASRTGPDASVQGCFPLHLVIIHTQEEMSIGSTSRCDSLWDSQLWQRGNRNMCLGARDNLFQEEFTIRLDCT